MERIAEILSKPCFLQYCKNILGERYEWKASDLLSEVTYNILKKEQYFGLPENELKAVFLKIAKTEAHKKKSMFNKKFVYNSFDSGFISKLIEDKNSDCTYYLNGTKKNVHSEQSEEEKEAIERNRERIEAFLEESEEDSEELYFFKNVARLHYQGRTAYSIHKETGINVQSINKAIDKFINYVKDINNFSYNSEDFSI